MPPVIGDREPLARPCEDDWLQSGRTSLRHRYFQDAARRAKVAFVHSPAEAKLSLHSRLHVSDRRQLSGRSVRPLSGGNGARFRLAVSDPKSVVRGVAAEYRKQTFASIPATANSCQFQTVIQRRRYPNGSQPRPGKRRISKTGNACRILLHPTAEPGGFVCPTAQFGRHGG